MAKAQRKAAHDEIIYGVHPIIECFKAGRRRITAIYMTKPEPKGWKRIKPYLPQRRPQMQYVTRDVLDRLAGTADHMGVVAYVTPFTFSTKDFTPEQKPRVLVLDGVKDVRNLGAIIRSAYCTNVDAIIMSKKGCASMTAAVFKASAGLAEHMPVYQVPSLGHSLNQLKRAGYHIYMAVADGGQCATETTFDRPMAIVIGSEEKGIDEKVREHGTMVTLPQRDTSSYNASVAAGIFLFLTQFNKK